MFLLYIKYGTPNKVHHSYLQYCCDQSPGLGSMLNVALCSVSCFVCICVFSIFHPQSFPSYAHSHSSCPSHFLLLQCKPIESALSEFGESACVRAHCPAIKAQPAAAASSRGLILSPAHTSTQAHTQRGEGEQPVLPPLSHE